VIDKKINPADDLRETYGAGTAWVPSHFYRNQLVWREFRSADLSLRFHIGTSNKKLLDYKLQPSGRENPRIAGNKSYPFGRTVLSIDDALCFITDEDIFWVMT
jgi:hypothetical protein